MNIHVVCFPFQVHYGENVHCGHCMLKFIFVIIVILRNVFIIDVTLVWNNIGWTIYDDSYTTEKNAKYRYCSGKVFMPLHGHFTEIIAFH